jgi:hypothetical protein
MCDNPLGLGNKVNLTINHNTYIGGYPCIAEIALDYGAVEKIMTPDKKVYKIKKGDHHLSIYFYKQDKIVNNGNYVYWGHTVRDISVDKDETINTYDIAEKG